MNAENLDPRRDRAHASAAFHPALAQSSRLEVVKARGILRCGVNPNFVGFALPDSAGQWRGFDVDMCRAVAAAVLGDSAKAQYIPLSAKDRFTALQTGDIDMLARNATWTLSRNTKLGINFVATNFYDGQAFMVKTASNIKSVNDLNGASICVIAGTDTERNLADFFGSRKIEVLDHSIRERRQRYRSLSGRPLRRVHK